MTHPEDLFALQVMELEQQGSTKNLKIETVKAAPTTQAPDLCHPSWLDDDPLAQNLYYGLYPMTLSKAWDFSIEAYNLMEPKEQYPFSKILPKGAAELRAKTGGSGFFGSGTGTGGLPEMSMQAPV